MMANMIHPQPLHIEHTSSPTAEWDDAQLVAALRQGDETAFMMLVERYHTSLVRLARLHTSSDELAEQIAQETWLVVLDQLEGFEGQLSLRAWVFALLMSRARIRSQREGSGVPAFAQSNDGQEPAEPVVDPRRFSAAEPGKGHWTNPPQEWVSIQEEQVLSAETHAHVNGAIVALPLDQRIVLTLRDVEGLSAQEVCAILEVSEVQQRALLHQARSRIRAALEQVFER